MKSNPGVSRSAIFECMLLGMCLVASTCGRATRSSAFPVDVSARDRMGLYGAGVDV